jgi:hypothetical protein
VLSYLIILPIRYTCDRQYPLRSIDGHYDIWVGIVATRAAYDRTVSRFHLPGNDVGRSLHRNQQQRWHLLPVVVVVVDAMPNLLSFDGTSHPPKGQWYYPKHPPTP